MSLFKNFDPDAKRIKESQNKINQYPEKKIVKYLPRSHKIPPESMIQEVSEEELLEQLKTEEARLIEQLNRIKNREKEVEKEIKKKIPLAVSFRRCSYNDVSFELNKADEDFLEVVRKFNNTVSSNGIYFTPIWTYPEFESEVLKKLPYVKFINFEQVKEPYWKIKERDKNIALQWNPITNPLGSYKTFGTETEYLHDIPGITKRDKFYEIPLNEGWRLYSIHPEVKTRLCEWVDIGLVDKVRVEFEKRLRVRSIHSAEDSTFDQEFEALPDFKLRAHQRVALEFADLVEHKMLTAFDTGTGKTAIAIADAIKVNAQKVLVITSGALRANWRNHIHKHTGYDPVVLAGRVPGKEDMRFLMKNKPKWLIINYDIIRTKVDIEKEKDPNSKYTLKESEEYFPWVELLNLYMPDYIIVDECHYMKNPSASQSKAVRQLESPRKMALSATPIMNRPGELWSVLNWLHPEQFKYYETFLNQYGWGRSIQKVDATKLRSILETIMLKRSRQDISKNLPPINRIIETYEMSDRARKIYDRILMGIYEEMATYDYRGKGGEIKEFQSLLPKINAMIKVCAADKIRYTVERAVELAEDMEDSPWNKIIIFSKFRGTSNTISRMLGGEAISFVDRTNTGFKTVPMEERMIRVNEFQTNPNIKFLTGTEGSAREGLDITKAGVVMFNDLFWNPAAHIQCEGRAFYRESDMHGGDSYYLQMEDSIEEWITELQGIKDDTIKKVIEGKDIESSITNEIMKRLRDLFDKRTR